MKLPILIACFVAATSVNAQTLLPGAGLLFKDVITKLSVADKNDIFKKSGYRYSDKENKLYAFSTSDPVSDSMEHFKTNVLPMDMNHDGIEEIFIIAYINSDEGFYCYIKKNGSYIKTEMMYESDIPFLLQSKNLGYNDIDAGYTKYRFDGTNYKLFKGATGTKLKKLDFYSAAYTSSLK